MFLRMLFGLLKYALAGLAGMNLLIYTLDGTGMALFSFIACSASYFLLLGLDPAI